MAIYLTPLEALRALYRVPKELRAVFFAGGVEALRRYDSSATTSPHWTAPPRITEIWDSMWALLLVDSDDGAERLEWSVRDEGLRAAQELDAKLAKSIESRQAQIAQLTSEETSALDMKAELVRQAGELRAERDRLLADIEALKGETRRLGHKIEDQGVTLAAVFAKKEFPERFKGPRGRALAQSLRARKKKSRQ